MKTFHRPLFWAVVGVPNIISALYFCFIASAVYVSTASLIVYKPGQSAQSLSSMLSGAGGGNSAEGAYIVKDYIGSWDEYRNVARAINLPLQYGQGDVVSRFGGLKTFFRKSDITLWHYYQSHVNVAIDQNSGIISLSVEGYSPTIATAIAEQVLQDSIRHIDSMNRQQEADYMKNALERRTSVEEKLKFDEAALAAYRIATGIHDPSKLYASNLVLLNALSEQKTRDAAQLDAIARATPNNPVVQNLRAAIGAVQAKIKSTEFAGRALSRGAARYEELTVARDNDIALLHEVEAAVEQAQLNATKNKYYLNIISAPSRPHAPELPRRLEWMMGVLLGTLVLWGLLR
ncbi:chain length determinant family protein [Pandoraea thiooxydans]|uniref:Lipopolysaccharide biosynthesis protein n=1 Tax=Pandoraea thiooxydans TaxID=445709 RepID=A0A0G3EJ45_9BURK|nr:LPS biosynthesis protein [Pandoraea thiooxydans]AKJ66935.1 lipopolysaccharide biosynthesis protein [Pandoraea thiooxydans]APR93828.1 chain length determinant family protein [Pandoraea thiooxydans]